MGKDPYSERNPYKTSNRRATISPWEVKAKLHDMKAHLYYARLYIVNYTKDMLAADNTDAWMYLERACREMEGAIGRYESGLASIKEKGKR